MNKRIIYPDGQGGIAVLIPSTALSLEAVARKDVPQGVPYRIIERAEMPGDRTFRDAWEADFSNPDGFGDPKGWRNEQEQQA